MLKAVFVFRTVFFMFGFKIAGHMLYISTSALGAAHAKCWSKWSFSVFLQKSFKNTKSKKFAAKFCKKKIFFFFAPKRRFNVLFPKNSFLPKNYFLPKTVVNHYYFESFLGLIVNSYTKNDYFNQHLACAAPKRWLKYTTDICFHIVNL